MLPAAECSIRVVVYIKINAIELIIQLYSVIHQMDFIYAFTKLPAILVTILHYTVKYAARPCTHKRLHHTPQ